jgi:2-polyprenyl-3-methyl-5-hydroxy-6-metoxy-1,4-benzoquinol methylase
MNYKQKLIQFNSTEKYKSELKFLHGLIGNETAPVLDYGCGIGTAVRYFDERLDCIVKGYDPNDYGIHDTRIMHDEPQGEYGHIYFMHSLAHIPDVDKLLVKLKDNLLPKGKITVITPNLDWLNYMNHFKETRTDTTVIKHFMPNELESLFNKLGYHILIQGQFGQFGQFYDGCNERLFIQVQK